MVPRSRVIEQPSRRCHDNIDAAVQPLDLRLDGHPAVDHRRAQRQAPGIIVHLFADLGRQLAGRHQDQRARSTPLLRRNIFTQPLHDRQGKGRGLAGAGLGAGQQVASLKNHRDCRV